MQLRDYDWKSIGGSVGLLVVVLWITSPQLFALPSAEWVTAAFTAVLSVSTIYLWRATSQQAQLNLKSLEVSRAEFISTHRPRVVLREAIIGSVLEGEPIGVIMNFANTGETMGLVVRSVIDLRVVETSAPIPLFNNSVEPFNELGTRSLRPGESVLINFSALQKRPNSDRNAPRWNADLFLNHFEGAFQKRKANIHLVGEILYQDDAGISRRTRFCRVLIPEKQRFYKIENEPDLDYSD